VGVARHQRAGHPHKMTIGVTYDGALGKFASRSPLARSAVVREPFRAGPNTGRRSPAPRKTARAAFPG
jgi:hypothetical protein